MHFDDSIKWNLWRLKRYKPAIFDRIVDFHFFPLQPCTHIRTHNPSYSICILQAVFLLSLHSGWCCFGKKCTFSAVSNQGKAWGIMMIVCGKKKIEMKLNWPFFSCIWRELLRRVQDKWYFWVIKGAIRNGCGTHKNRREFFLLIKIVILSVFLFCINLFLVNCTFFFAPVEPASQEFNFNFRRKFHLSASKIRVEKLFSPSCSFFFMKLFSVSGNFTRCRMESMSEGSKRLFIL